MKFYAIIAISITAAAVAGEDACGAEEKDAAAVQQIKTINPDMQDGLAEANESSSSANGEKKNLDTISTDQEAQETGWNFGGMMSSAKKWLESTFGSVISSVKEWIKSVFGTPAPIAEETLQNASEDLKMADVQNTDAELDASKTVQNINESWLHAIKVVRYISDAGKMTDKTTEFADDVVRSADKLARSMADMALKKARAALANAQNAEQDGFGRLLSAVETVENAEMATNANGCEGAEEYVRAASELVQASIVVVVSLVVKGSEYQRSNGILGFSEAMKGFGEAVQEFSSKEPHKPVLQCDEALRQNAGKVEQEAGKMEQGAAVMGMPLSRILEGVRRAVYVMLPSTSTLVLAQDKSIVVLVKNFDKAMRIIMSELDDTKNVKSIAEQAINAMGGPGSEARALNATTARLCISEIKKRIAKIKEESKLMNEYFSEMTEMIAKGGQGKASDAPEQGINIDAYILQKSIMVCRRSTLEMMKIPHILEKSIAELEPKAAEEE